MHGRRVLSAKKMPEKFLYLVDGTEACYQGFIELIACL